MKTPVGADLRVGIVPLRAILLIAISKSDEFIVAFAAAFTWGDSGTLALWTDFIVGVDRVIEVFGCEAREPGLRRHPAGDRFGKSERA